MKSPPLRNLQSRLRGSVLLVAVLLLAFVSTVIFTGLTLVTERTKDVRISAHRMTAQLAAKSGVQRLTADIKAARDAAGPSFPFSGLDALDPNPATGPGGYTPVLTGEPLIDLDGNKVAEYDVMVDVVTVGSNTRNIEVTSYAYVPDRPTYDAGHPDAVRADAHAVIEATLRAGEVFDYSYFINHWGWFFGDQIVANGNVRSNGQFDFGNYRSTINGSPRYRTANGNDLIGYIDDNRDGVTDGSDGGVYSGMGVINSGRIRGMGSATENQHQLFGGLPMPNLSDLTKYEQVAVDKGGSIQISGGTVVSGVLGDDPSEKQHLYLHGTPTDPVVLNGPVVVRGSVVVSGHVTGQGSIYSGGNVYVAGDIHYVDPPATPRPTANDEATVESWRESATGKDSLGLYAREHVVIGDYTNSTWQYYVKSWINNSHNKSAEDAGIDGIHNTRYGLDGIAGTADDDVLEGDGVWTVARYTTDDTAAGRIPPGKGVGDVIPGSGEDIDGDGQYDGTTQMSEFNLPAALDPANWAGNLTGSYSSFRDVSTVYIRHIDATFYTNHTLAALMLNSGGDIDINGSIVSRNESIIYSANHINMNHDERLTGRGDGATAGFYTPLAWDPLTFVQWDFDRELPDEVVSSPDAIAGYWTGGGDLN